MNDFSTRRLYSTGVGMTSQLRLNTSGVTTDEAREAPIGRSTDQKVARIVGAPECEIERDPLPPMLRFSRWPLAAYLLTDWLAEAVDYASKGTSVEGTRLTTPIPTRPTSDGHVCHYDPHVEDGEMVHRGQTFGETRPHAKARMTLLLKAKGLL